MSDMFSRPELDARLKGVLFQNIETGTSAHEYIFPFDCKFNGIAIYSTVSKLGTRIKMETYYNAGPYGWKKYKKFADFWNLYPNYVCKNVLFPTEPSAGVKIVFTIENNEGAPIDFGANLFQFTESEKVQPSLLQQGEDW
jgi:hypothetical protein